MVQTGNDTSRNQTTLTRHRPLLRVNYLPTTATASLVPVPAAVWFLASGVVFLSARRKALG